MPKQKTVKNNIDLLKIVREASEKKLSYAFAGVTVAVAIILMVFAIRPTIITITRIRSEISTKEKTEKGLEDKITALTELDTQYIGLEDDFNNISLVFPTEGNFSLFMANIDAVASRNSFVLKGLTFSEYKDESPLNSTVLEPWSVSINIEGEKVNLINFLKDLESLPMYPVIESVSFGDKDEEEALNFTVKLRIYHVKINNFYE